MNTFMLKKVARPFKLFVRHSLFGQAHPTLITICLLATFFVSTPFSLAKGPDPEEKVYYFLQDHLGGVDVVLDEEANVVERRDYLPYGNERLRIADNTKTKENYGFTGKELDEETGLYYYGARYYDPTIGRFIQLDPLILDESSKPLESVLANPQALNGYSYVLNNPLRYVDEDGEYGKDVHYDLTLFLGTISGLKHGQAKTIAYRNQYTDENPETAPSSNNWLSDPAKVDRYHFAERKIAKNNLEAAINTKSSPTFGRNLHVLQDAYSHEGLTQIEHIKLNLNNESPDDTFRGVTKAMEMAKETFLYLRKFNLKTQGSGDLTPSEYRLEGINIWRKNKSEIKNYLSSGNKGETSIAKQARESEKDN